jgi:hypothetical protein
VEVSEGTVTVEYDLSARKARVTSEYLAFFPDLASVAPDALDDLEGGYAFGTPVSIADALRGDASQLLFVRIGVTYQPRGGGVARFSDTSEEHQALIQRLMPLLAQ